MKRQILAFITFVVLLTAISSSLLGGVVSAASGGCYFGAGTCSVSGDGAYGTNDIFTGRSSAGSPDVLAGINTKTEFKNFVVARFGGGAHNKTGAQFIMARMLGTTTRPGSTTNWVNLMNQDSVTLSIDYNASVSKTSWYDPGDNDTFFDTYSDAPRIRDIIIIKQSGTVIAEVEIPCGNLVAIGSKLGYWKMQATSSVQSQAFAGQPVTWAHNVTNVGTAKSDLVSGNVAWSSDTTAPIPAAYGVKGGIVIPGKAYSRLFNPGAADDINPSYPFTIPANAPISNKYCQHIYGTPTAYNDSTSFNSLASPNRCVTVIAVPAPQANPSAGLTSTFLPGAAVTGTASVTNGVAYVNSSSTWIRTMWMDTVIRNGKYDPGEVYINTLTPGPISGGPTTYIGGTTNTFPLLPGTIPATAHNGDMVCTALALNVASFNPANTTTIGSPPGYAFNCQPVVIPGAQPYFSVLGGDIAAGPGFGSGASCTPNTDADITGSNKGSSGYEGADAQLAALALRNITAFATSKKQSGATWIDSLTNVAPVANSAARLAFANSPTLGSFGQAGWCVPDYYNNVANTANDPGPDVNFGSLGSGTYYHNGPLTLRAGSLPASGQKIILKVNGDVYITRALLSAFPEVSYASAPSVGTIPEFQLLASGSIYVDPSITRLDGFYDAQAGSFVSCGDKSSGVLARITGTAAISGCNTQLTVNGAVAAKKVIPNRTRGDREARYSQLREPGELFRFSPQFWLPSISGGGAGTGAWQSVTSLPPIL